MAVSSIEVIIPEGEIQYFKQIVQLPLQVLHQVGGALLTAIPTLDSSALSHDLCQATQLPNHYIAPLITVLWRWAMIQRHMDVDPATFLDVLRTNLLGLAEDVWSREDTQRWDERRLLLLQMLKSESALGTSAKAGELLMMQDSLFLKARVLTDIRPVFTDQGEQIQGYIPFHTLGITTIKDGEEHQLHLVLDYHDLQQLQEQVKRAMNKEHIIREQLSAANITIINTGSEPNAEIR